MRIDCEQCGAAYAIDDSLITPRGVRAQCPKCSHQKVVRKTAAEPEPPPPAASPFGTPFAGTPAPNPFSQGSATAAPDAASPFGAPADAPPSPFASPKSGPTASPFGAAPQTQSPFSAGASPFAAPEVPQTSNPFADAEAPSAAPPDVGASPFAAPPPAANPFAAPEPASEQPDIGVETTDPFAGLTATPSMPSDNPFAAEGEAPDVFNEPELDVSGGGPPQWQIRVRGELRTGLGLSEVRSMIRSGELQGSDLAAPEGEALGRIDQNPSLAVSLEPSGPSKPLSARKKSSSSRGLSTGAKVGILVMLVVTAFVVAYIVDPALFKFESGPDRGANPFARATEQWSLELPAQEGTTAFHVEEGKKRMQLDTAAGYKKADEHFRVALLNDPKNIEAIAGYVENYARLPNVRTDAAGTALARDGVNWALDREPKNLPLIRAKASLRLAMSDEDAFDDAVSLISTARSQGDTSNALKLVEARAHLDRNPNRAATIAGALVATQPDMRAAVAVLGGAERRLGNFAKAKEVLQGRLEKDAGNIAARRELALLALDLSRFDDAITELDQLIASNERDIEARLLRARVRYQGKNQAPKAAEELQFVVDNFSKVAGDLLPAVLTDLAFVKGVMLGDLDAGLALIERARKRDATYAPALFVSAQISARGQQIGPALTSAKAAESKLRDGYHEADALVVLGDIERLGGELQNAVTHYSSAINEAPRLTRAHLGLITALLEGKQSESAFVTAREMLDIDPLSSDRDTSLSDYPTSRRDLVTYAKAIGNAKVSKAQKPLRDAARGVALFHAGERAEAKRALTRALSKDKLNQAALLYIGALDVDARRYRKAQSVLERALSATGGTHAMTRAYLAEAYFHLDKLDEAQKHVDQALDDQPTNLVAKMTSAKILNARGNRAEARKVYADVLRDNPGYLPVKRALADWND